jgi:serpin B
MNTLLKIDPNVTLSLANSLWANKDYEFKQDFLKINREYYKAEIQSLDFKSPQAPKTINDWVKKNTNNKIEKIVDTIPDDAILYLINAVYFKGAWKVKFDEKNTKEDDFKLLNNKTKKVKFMNKEGKFNYYKDKEIQVVELPYGNEKVSMFIFLPASSLNDFIKQLNFEKFKKWLSKLQTKRVNVSIPKFKLEYEEKLNKVLESLGLKIAFDSERADFSNMFSGAVISEVSHKTFIEVNEKGTEAAAVTSVHVLSITPQFIANKPFFFVIKDNSTNIILFMGAVYEPNEE